MEDTNIALRLVNSQQIVLFYIFLFEIAMASRSSPRHPDVQIPRMNVGQETVHPFHPYLSKQRYGDSKVQGSSKYKRESFTSQRAAALAFQEQSSAFKLFMDHPHLQENVQTPSMTQRPLHFPCSLSSSQSDLPLTYLQPDVQPTIPQTQCPRVLIMLFPEASSLPSA